MTTESAITVTSIVDAFEQIKALRIALKTIRDHGEDNFCVEVAMEALKQ